MTICSEGARSRADTNVRPPLNLDAIMAYVHPGVIFKLRLKDGMTSDRANEAFHGMLQFLCVCAQPPGNFDGPFGPPRDVDLAWHHFILHTNDYLVFCQKHFGRFIHHAPDAPPAETLSDEEVTSMRERCVTETSAAEAEQLVDPYEEAFGPQFYGDTSGMPLVLKPNRATRTAAAVRAMFPVTASPIFPINSGESAYCKGGACEYGHCSGNDDSCTGGGGCSGGE